LVISRGPDNIALAILMPRTRSCSDAGTAFPAGIIAIALLLYAPEAPVWSGELKQFPAYLNRWDSQQARNEGVFAH